MRKFLPTLLLLTLLTACGNSATQTSQAPTTATTKSFTLSAEQKETLTSFFQYFSEGNYENMKDFCSKDYVNDFFHKNDVFGFKTAKLLSYDETNIITHDKEYWIPISLKVEPTKDSSSYDKNSKFVEVSYYVVLEQQTNGKWLVTNITSG